MTEIDERPDQDFAELIQLGNLVESGRQVPAQKEL
jgi:hypothetical protein